MTSPGADLLRALFAGPPRAATLDELIEGLTFHQVDFSADYTLENPDSNSALVATRAEANVVSSRIAETESLHKVLLDIDVPAWFMPSSTEGHGHFFADVTCTWEDYLAFLRAAVKIGLIEGGYVAVSEVRGFTSLRLPGVTKNPGDKR